jgi:hypothetical protein
LSISIPLFLAKSKRKPWLRIFDEKILIIIIPLGLLIANHYVKIFAGTLNTSTELLQMIIPYLALMFVGFIGFNLIRNTESRYRGPIVSIFLGAITVMSFGFLRGLDPFSFDLIYRSYDYIDIGLAVCIGVGFVYIMKSSWEKTKSGGGKKGRKASTAKKAAIAIIAFILISSTVPLAYSGETLWGIRNTTEEREYNALVFIDQIEGDISVGTDQRLEDIAKPHFGFDANMTFPWGFRQARSLGYDYLLVEDEWKSIGAQMYPFENVKISEEDFDAVLDSTDLVYSGGSDRVVYVLKVRG